MTIHGLSQPPTQGMNPLEVRRAARDVIADFGVETLRGLDDVKLRMTVADALPALDTAMVPSVVRAVRRILTPIHTPQQESAEDVVNKLLDSDMDEAFTINPPTGYEAHEFTVELKGTDVMLSNAGDTTGESASVKFALDEEWRSWGLKSLTPIVRSILLTYSVIDENGEESPHELMITPENFKISTEGGDRIPCTAQEIDLDLTAKTAKVTF